MKLTVNLVTQRPVDGVVLRKLCNAILVLLVTSLIIVLGYMVMVRHRHQNVRELLALTTADVSSGQANTGDDQALQAESAKAEIILKRRAFQWSQILNHLEQTGIDGIQIRSIEPNFDKQSLSIQVLARDEAVFREYFGNLLQYKLFSEVLLLRQENVDIKDYIGQNFSVIRCEISIRGGF
jgi:Tfp pilus assembly protein PilN